MNHSWFPSFIYDRLRHYNKTIEIELNDDNPVEGGVNKFVVSATKFNKSELEILFELTDWFYMDIVNNRMCVTIII